jgi:hypothetical protein
VERLMREHEGIGRTSAHFVTPCASR